MCRMQLYKIVFALNLEVAFFMLTQTPFPITSASAAEALPLLLIDRRQSCFTTGM